MKENLRKKIIDIRKKLSNSDVLEKSSIIKKRLFEMIEFKKASTILFYVSYDNEVYTHDMIKESINCGKNVLVPITDTKKHCLTISRLKRWDNLEQGSYSILEPKKECICEVPLDNKINLILVPGVAFDESGNRLGHGYGYYDNLLKQSEALSIGLAFEFQIVKNIPYDMHDVPLNKIVTEKRVIDCIN